MTEVAPSFSHPSLQNPFFLAGDLLHKFNIKNHTWTSVSVPKGPEIVQDDNFDGSIKRMSSSAVIGSMEASSFNEETSKDNVEEKKGGR
mmetsp:Transcript_31285/g.47880  ORF Transcript_31285/g.47880 Transcript_31285/m.47880 type:complete len:89 (-) Transcript_31285:1081-1347(-)